VTLLYFAWVRQKTGCSGETMELPASVTTVGELARFLRARGPGYADAFAETDRLRAAINQEHVDFASPLTDTDEVAFFPPVTGG
jgi:molybdopterin synthase sulfur carrier subunit